MCGQVFWGGIISLLGGYHTEWCRFSSRLRSKSLHVLLNVAFLLALRKGTRLCVEVNIIFIQKTMFNSLNFTKAPTSMIDALQVKALTTSHY